MSRMDLVNCSVLTLPFCLWVHVSWLST